ncbi:hypothetical protein EJB05_45647, partial [Eragrostis curvula]
PPPSLLTLRLSSPSLLLHWPLSPVTRPEVPRSRCSPRAAAPRSRAHVPAPPAVAKVDTVLPRRNNSSDLEHVGQP